MNKKFLLIAIGLFLSTSLTNASSKKYPEYSPLINPHQPPLTGSYGTTPDISKSGNSSATSTNSDDALGNNYNNLQGNGDAYNNFNNGSPTTEIASEQDCCTIL